jgi:hypothetical protein
MKGMKVSGGVLAGQKTSDLSPNFNVSEVLCKQRDDVELRV